MKALTGILVGLIGCVGCAKQPRLPLDSQYSVTAMRNDSTWFGTAKGIRLFASGKAPESAKEFNLQIITDIDFPGNGSYGQGKSPFVTGCTDSSGCVPTQRLHIYNIPLKKRKFRISKLDRHRKINLEKTTYWLLIDGSGVAKEYNYTGRKPGWIRITNFDKKTNTAEGRFSLSLDENLKYTHRLKNGIPPTAGFRDGLFRVRLTDVKIR